MSVRNTVSFTRLAGVHWLASSAIARFRNTCSAWAAKSLLPTHDVDQQAERQRGAGLRDPCRCADDPEAIGVVLWTEDRERHGAARNGQNAVAGAVKDGKHARRATACQSDNGGTDRMRQARQPARHQRVIAGE